jgi:hypothetical protein
MYKCQMKSNRALASPCVPLPHFLTIFSKRPRVPFLARIIMPEGPRTLTAYTVVNVEYIYVQRCFSKS